MSRSRTDAELKRRGTDAYMPQLDSLRAIAVFSVLLYHFYPFSDLPAVFQIIPWGLWRVQLFFVLSGFLISGILIRARSTAETEGTSRLFALRQFYIRRVLRIFPIYYLVILIAWLMNLGDTRDTVGWLLTYTYNLLAAERGQAGGSFAYLWSLNVEEQFYLVWPWLLLFLPRRFVPAALGAAVIFAPIFRLVTYEDAGIAGYLLAPSSLDMLGMGGILALAYDHSPPERVGQYLRWIALPSGLLLLGVAALRPGGLSWEIANVAAGFGAAVTFFWLIGSAAQGFRGLVGRALEWTPLRYLGKISYGIYVYHLFVPPLVAFFVWLGGPWLGGGPYWSAGIEGFLVYSTISVVIAGVSWQLIERPANGLKRFFPVESTGRRSKPGLLIGGETDASPAAGVA